MLLVLFHNLGQLLFCYCPSVPCLHSVYYTLKEESYAEETFARREIREI